MVRRRKATMVLLYGDALEPSIWFFFSITTAARFINCPRITTRALNCFGSRAVSSMMGSPRCLILKTKPAGTGLGHDPGCCHSSPFLMWHCFSRFIAWSHWSLDFDRKAWSTVLGVISWSCIGQRNHQGRVKLQNLVCCRIQEGFERTVSGPDNTTGTTVRKNQNSKIWSKPNMIRFKCCPHQRTAFRWESRWEGMAPIALRAWRSNNLFTPVVSGVSNDPKRESPSSILLSVPHSREDGDSRRPKVFTHIFGCLAFKHIPAKIPRKLDEHATPAVYLGLDPNCRAYLLGSLYQLELSTSVEVTFVENVFPFRKVKHRSVRPTLSLSIFPDGKMLEEIRLACWYRQNLKCDSQLPQHASWRNPTQFLVRSNCSHTHFADSTHISLRSMIHPLRVRCRKSLLDSLVSTKCLHFARDVHSTVVWQNPRDAVWTNFCFNHFTEISNHSCDLTKNPNKRRERSSKMRRRYRNPWGVATENGPRKSVWNPWATRLALSNPLDKCGWTCDSWYTRCRQASALERGCCTGSAVSTVDLSRCHKNEPEMNARLVSKQ